MLQLGATFPVVTPCTYGCRTTFAGEARLPCEATTDCFASVVTNSVLTALNRRPRATR